MINFFRKIRKKMADDNKPLKYVRYAIGEIVLVVVGILIALQVNNWNETQKQRHIEIYVLEELASGLSQDLNVLKYNIDKHERAIKSCDIILEVMEGNREFVDSLDRHFAATHYYTVSFSKRGAYESLKSMGIEIISNKKLRVKVIDLYEQWFKIIQVNQEILREEIQTIKRNFNQDNFDQFQIFDIENFNRENANDLYAGQMIPNDFSALKKSKQYRYYLKSLHASHSFVNFQFNISLEMVNEIIDELNNEINRLK